MRSLLMALGFFILSVVTHAWFCRRKTKEQLLVKLFCVIAGINFVIFCFIDIILTAVNWINTGSGYLWDTPMTVSAAVVYVLLIPTYMIFYVSTELNSPSKTVLLLLRAHGAMTEEELLKYFSDAAYILPRLHDLTIAGCITYRENGQYVLSSSGLRISRFLKFYQVFLGRHIGG